MLYAIQKGASTPIPWRHRKLIIVHSLQRIHFGNFAAEIKAFMVIIDTFTKYK